MAAEIGVQRGADRHQIHADPDHRAEGRHDVGNRGDVGVREAGRAVRGQGDDRAGADRVQQPVGGEGNHEDQIIRRTLLAELPEDGIPLEAFAFGETVAGHQDEVLPLGRAGLGCASPGLDHPVIDRAVAGDLLEGAVAELLALPAALAGPGEAERFQLGIQGRGREMGPPEGYARLQQPVGEAGGDDRHRGRQQGLIGEPAAERGESDRRLVHGAMGCNSGVACRDVIQSQGRSSTACGKRGYFGFSQPSPYLSIGLGRGNI